VIQLELEPVTPARRLAPLIVVTLAALAPLASSAAASVTVNTPSVTATENVAFTGTVATFTSEDSPAQPASMYSATINWGDGTEDTATVTGAKGIFTVSLPSGHTYAEGGSPTVTVTVNDTFDSTHGSAQGTATVADAPLSATGPSAPTLAEGAASATQAVHFTDTDTAIQPASHYSATISWGDGTSSPATITGAGGEAGYDVTVVPHVYDEEGAYSLVVTITDVGGAQATVTIPVTVLDAPLTATPAAPVNLGGAAFSGQLATFTDADPGANEADYSAQILWGDGSASAGTIAAGTGGVFAVTGSHTYGISGTYTVTVLVRDSGGQSATAQTSLTATAPRIIACADAAASAAMGTGPASGECPPLPRFCIVPRLKGMSLAAAERALARALCKLGKVTRPRRAGHSHGRPAKPTGPLVVVGQSPAAGIGEPAGKPVAVRLAPAPRRTAKHRK
jgi:hypothetical protein